MIKIEDFCDMTVFESLMDAWAKSTGLATVAVGADGKYISECYNFTDFCIKLTRGSAEGCKRCEKCDREGKGVYECHAGLVDFGIPITLSDGTVLGSVIGGQVLPENPDEDKFRETAIELGINPQVYLNALHKVNIKTREEIEASAHLLGNVINMFVRTSYAEKNNEVIVGRLIEGIDGCAQEISDANNGTREIRAISSKQKILALNASIEAARAGEHGKGFAIVARQVEMLAAQLADTSSKITQNLEKITAIVENMHQK